MDPFKDFNHFIAYFIPGVVLSTALLMLISWGLDIKTVQTLLRHSNVTTTLDIYSQGVDKHRSAAQGLMMDAVMNPASEMLQ